MGPVTVAGRGSRYSGLCGAPIPEKESAARAHAAKVRPGAVSVVVAMREDPSKVSSSANIMDAADRRKAVRVPHCAPFVLRPLTGTAAAESVTVVLQDLSATGMGIIHSEPLRLGDRFEVPLERQATGAAALSLVCTVVRCERMDEDLYSIGFEFNSSAAAIDAGSRQLTGMPAPRP